MNTLRSLFGTKRAEKETDEREETTAEIPETEASKIPILPNAFTKYARPIDLSVEPTKRGIFTVIPPSDTERKARTMSACVSAGTQSNRKWKTDTPRKAIDVSDSDTKENEGLSKTALLYNPDPFCRTLVESGDDSLRFEHPASPHNISPPPIPDTGTTNDKAGKHRRKRILFDNNVDNEQPSPKRQHTEKKWFEFVDPDVYAKCMTVFATLFDPSSNRKAR